MIIKIQMPRHTRGPGEPQAVICDRFKTFKTQIPASLVASWMAGAEKAFFYAEVLDDGTLHIERDAEWQGW